MYSDFHCNAASMLFIFMFCSVLICASLVPSRLEFRSSMSVCADISCIMDQTVFKMSAVALRSSVCCCSRAVRTSMLSFSNRFPVCTHCRVSAMSACLECVSTSPMEIFSLTP